MRKKHKIFDILFYSIIFLTFIITVFVAQRGKVSGSSMYPTLHDGDNFIANKFIYHIEEPQRNDIIAFHPQSCSRGVYFIKRIIGLPGDTIQINQNGDIIINNQIYQEKLDLDTILYTGIASEPIYIKQNEYFVLGDNRNNSVDSRFPEVGLVKKKDIIGKAIFLPTH